MRLSGAALRTDLQLPVAGPLRDRVHTNFERKWSVQASLSMYRTPAGKARTGAEDSLALSLAQRARLLQGNSPYT
jgi:hypothetical protein